MPLSPLLGERLQDLVLALELAGTFVFAISGAMLGVRRRLDVFSVLVLSFAASSAGGITRDLLIGSVPPAASSDWRYLATAIAAGVTVFVWYSPVSRLRTAIAVSDAAGLALFAVSDAQKALAFGLNPLASALMGMLTGVGGGMARDLLVARTPAVLQGELYAVAALTGATQSDEALRQARGGRRTGRLPPFRRGRVHQLSGHHHRCWAVVQVPSACLRADGPGR